MPVNHDSELVRVARSLAEHREPVALHDLRETRERAQRPLVDLQSPERVRPALGRRDNLRHAPTGLKREVLIPHVRRLAVERALTALFEYRGQLLPLDRFHDDELFRSEERRVGEEGRSRWSPDHFKAEDGIRDLTVTGVQTCALPISSSGR